MLRMRVTQTMDMELDPETMCTRVMARLIEDIGCVAIAPDSPAWSDLGSDLGKEGGGRAGELRIYRGRGRVQKIVSAHLQQARLDSQSLVVFTQPMSAVPHLVVDAAREDERVSVRVDLLPKRDVTGYPEYFAECYQPLMEAYRSTQADARFVPQAPVLQQRALMSPVGVMLSVATHDLYSAQTLIERYLGQWVSLLRSRSAVLSDDWALVEHDMKRRKLLFSRAVDPGWDRLDPLVGVASVERILAALTG